MFNGQKKHEDEPIKQAQEFIESNVGERISVEDLALKYAIGRRHFERRFKKATNNTPVEYIQRVKMEAAKKFLENSQKNVTEVMYEVGYRSEEHTSELQSLMRISYAVFCLKKKKKI